MNKNIFTMVMFCFSFIFCPSISNLENEIYTKVSEELCDIEEYGMKIEYLTNENINKELNNLYNSLKIKDFTIVEESEGVLYLENSNDEIKLNISLLKENRKNRVQVEIISKYRIDFNYIKEYFQVIHNKNISNIKYYTYIKGDIRENNNIDEIEEKLIELINNKYVIGIQKINLENGTTGIINLKSDYQFNYSIMTYEEDRKLILGTPIIFTTY
ncbi:hypothetical protein QYB59_001098 [Clostridium perfringens]|nr:hypothetical protein [Clostridium perfringens]